jgi:hypothetical protein
MMTPRARYGDVVRWKEARLALAVSKTVANYIGELRPIWTWGRTNRKPTFTANPFAGLAPKMKKQGALRAPGPYTEDEARRVRCQAISQTGPGPARRPI